MICRPCMDAADAQRLLVTLMAHGKTDPADLPEAVPHPTGCGCACRHRLAGSVRFDVK